jgi:hypothetical protein
VARALHSLPEVAREAGITYRHVRRLVDHGRLPAIHVATKRVGTPQWHVLDEDLQAWLAGRKPR